MSKNDTSFLIARIERLEAFVFKGEKNFSKDTDESSVQKAELDFSLNIRAFTRKFVAGKSGPRKFVLLLAYLVGGKTGKDVELVKIQKEWNSMSSKRLLNGEFNRYYSNEAKTQGWVNSNERGIYCLSNSWRDAYE